MTEPAARFAPFTAEEVAARIAPSTKDDDWMPMVPPRTPSKADYRHHRLGEPTAGFRYYGADGQLQGFVLRFDLTDAQGRPDKTFLPLRWGRLRGHTGWQWKGWGDARPLYRLPQLLAAPSTMPVIVTEGEKKADRAAQRFPDHAAVAPMNGAKSPHKTDWRATEGRSVIIWPDHDPVGAEFAATVADLALTAGATDVRVVAVPDEFPAKWDLADDPPSGWNEDRLRSLLAAAEPVHTTANMAEATAPDKDETEIVRLAALTAIDYDRQREAAAKRLNVRVSALDDAVKTKRRARQEAAGEYALFPQIAPWPSSVTAAELLDDITQTVRRFIVCSPEIAAATALWAAFTWFIERVQVAPLLVITAPEKRCGKSQLLNLVERLACRPLVASNISSAAVYRVIEAHAPTLLLDEADSFFRDNEELRGVVNSGHTRQSAYVIRTVGDEHEPKRFSTWGAKAVAGIGHLAETIIDRAVVVELRRKLPHETADRLRHADPELFDVLRRKLARLADDGGGFVETARPNLPEALNDRAQDNWEPLLAIADYAGSHWPATARAVALKLSGATQEAVSLSAELLADIRKIFGEKGAEKLATADLLDALTADEERPWATYGRGKEMTPRHLAKRLAEYGIESQNLWFGHGIVKKGFTRAQFEDAFARYLPSPTSGNAAMPLGSAGNRGDVLVPSLADRSVASARKSLSASPSSPIGAFLKSRPEENQCVRPKGLHYKGWAF